MAILGIISPVEKATPWVSAMAATVKKDGTVRICIDPVHLNKALLRPYHPLKTVEQVTILTGWPESYKDVPHDICPFYAMRDELTVEVGVGVRCPSESFQ
ncbi:hypothetical protein QQF64_017030 [Cirrhinus molitorella]|uniref:Uncharacterized protein n=1 Tax=Cirrhinus molitorella TaxID=172907 RepID=A0ABR3LHH5_9TELE